MFRVEISNEDGIIDLVALMARQVGAEFGVRAVIETGNRSLAFAVGALFGKVVESDHAVSVLPEMRVAEGTEGRLADATVREIKEALAEMAEDKLDLFPAGPRVTFSDAETEEAIASRGKVERAKPKANGFCRYCGDPVGPKVVCCGKRECKLEQNREWQARYHARKSEGLVGKLVEEVAASEVPFVGSRPVNTGLMRVLGGSKTMLEYPEQEILKMIQYGALRDGQQIQDLSTRMLFEVRDGDLVELATLSKELTEPLSEGAMITLRKSVLGLDPVKSEENHAAA
jgi:hypothetical protein